MKTALIFVLLFLPLEVRAAPPIKTLGALEEFILRENIRDYEWIAREIASREAVKRDLRLLRHGSYDWFWKPRYLQKKIRGYEFEFSSEGSTPIIIMHF